MSDVRAVLDNEDSVLLDEAGSFVAEVEATENYKSRSDGDCLKVRLRVSTGEHEGRIHTAILSLQPQAIFRFKQLIRACGKDPATLTDSDDLVGCAVIMDIQTEEYEGEERLRVKRFRPAN